MKKFRVSVVHLLVSVFGLLITLGFCALAYIAIEESRNTLMEQLTNFAESTMASISERLVERLTPVQEQLRYLSSGGTVDVIAEGDYKRLGQTLDGALAATPQVLGLGFIGIKGDMTYVNRDSRSVMIGDWRQRSMPQIKRFLSHEPGQLVWLDPQWSETLGRSIMPALMPVKKGDRFLGLIIAVIAIEDLSAFLVELQSEFDGLPFVLYNSKTALAYPRLEQHFTLPSGPERPLPLLAELDDPVLAAYGAGEQEAFDLIDSPKMNSERVTVDGIRYVLLTKTLSEGALPSWTIGTYYSWDIVSERSSRFYILLGASTVLLLLMLLGAIWLSKRISNAVNRIVHAFDTFSRSDLSEVPTLEGSSIVELDRVASAFNLMVSSLKDFQFVKSMFVRYVPDTVAKRLLKGRGVLEPQEVEATVLFCDLQGFTQLAQQVRPAEIVEILNSYFNMVAECLEEEGGVITQFQGDAVLAIFNVPLPLEQHERRAIRASRQIIRRIERDTFAGRKLQCRIGICTGPMVAGVVGASDRANYTVHGDTVNLAARLEQVNKVYGTRILIDESTAKGAEPGTVRLVAETLIRGREGRIKVFTPGVPSVEAVGGFLRENC
ncbi:adenylate/guanylate cyclase domain-containing protein [Marinobacterium lutimaris]|uniref:Adenylate cyclase, class 3 n=1 Tax=Marinobacterium lutimaris TaxID=568106 RepID=A0A1H6D9C2_9GAMM|nr:adenylate/guanylate cyclase domain-containing protein [Marinobacterium lutimaris]SEG81096.1 Adenylate cyclase, class 3 [Marinobacterium lutimaris]